MGKMLKSLEAFLLNLMYFGLVCLKNMKLLEPKLVDFCWLKG